MVVQQLLLLSDGTLFRWRGAVYRKVRVEYHPNDTVHRVVAVEVATFLVDNHCWHLHSTPPRDEEFFNYLADVEPVTVEFSAV